MKFAAVNSKKAALSQMDEQSLNARAEEEQALLSALAAIFKPLAELCVARGLRITSVEDGLRASFVDAARRAQPVTTQRMTSVSVPQQA